MTRGLILGSVPESTAFALVAKGMQPDAVTVQQPFEFLRFLLFPTISMTQKEIDKER